MATRLSILNRLERSSSVEKSGLGLDIEMFIGLVSDRAAKVPVPNARYRSDRSRAKYKGPRSEQCAILTMS